MNIKFSKRELCCKYPPINELIEIVEAQFEAMVASKEANNIGCWISRKESCPMDFKQIVSFPREILSKQSYPDENVTSKD